jgi:transcriptional/translational regulatory protein YebC/TACO1
MGEFKLKNEGIDIDELELEGIDFGMEEIGEDADGNIVIRTGFNDFGNMSDFLEKKNITPIESTLTRIPMTTVELNDEQSKEVLELVDRLEQDDDVQKVYHNLK